MTDAEFEQQKQRLRALAEKWIRPLGLGWWRIDMEYERNPAPPPKDGYGEGFITSFRCSAEWRYGKASIIAYLPTIAMLSDEELEQEYVHELMHIFLNEARCMDKDDWLDHEERVATTLALAFVWLRKHVEDECRQAAALPEQQAA